MYKLLPFSCNITVKKTTEVRVYRNYLAPKEFNMKTSIILILLLTIQQSILAQACCTAGTPLLGSLEMSTTKKGAWQLGLNYEYNSLTKVYEGNSELIDRTRERVSQSILLEVSYGLTSRITLTTMLSFINQLRKVDPLSGQNNTLNSNGIGDVILLAKYSLISLNFINQQELAVGIGAKAPTGKSEVKENGILVPADMQPGTGSWDGILWAYYSRANLLNIPMNLLVNLSYRFNGTNKRFGSNFSSYKFGNEFISTLGLSYFTGSIVDPSLFLRYRNTSSDQFSSGDIPNTGGDWLYIVPGVNINLTDNLTLRATGQIPIYRNLIGTQLTTTFTTSVAFLYSISASNPLGI